MTVAGCIAGIYDDGEEQQRGEKSSGALSSSGNKGSGSDPTAADAHHPIINGGRGSSR
eukprot:CAMPEP_0113412398 /NCGR_PEP_ID=MMETSP0013_2-20120614/22812_1 /TAXON_ID=2843 ORGANISM="Skeletonema costatum, Strain 1716" /NCGR_SAMPLE_ID=MMETSP0013_2 /ASSEMBLY_ACC=CAM_ASM_000158 /LENGTH=57 /DNA_ID=CAMNT_0000298885 /DNA_START=753 /DNA_END=923 /DNA_ORIENTATION=+ /assembly_acc=CAM_ASM_000158